MRDFTVSLRISKSESTESRLSPGRRIYINIMLLKFYFFWLNMLLHTVDSVFLSCLIFIQSFVLNASEYRYALVGWL